MNISKILFICFACIVSSIYLPLHGQEFQKYSKAVIYLDDKHIGELGSLGIDITHGKYVPGLTFESDFSSYELKVIQDAGFDVDILVDDVAKYYVEFSDRAPLHAHHSRNRFPCPTEICGQGIGPRDIKDPVNFQLGVMNGFFDFQEIQSHLDAMAFAYPHIMSPEMIVPDIRTHENRPLSYYKITKNPTSNHLNRPKILHTALHHAREGITVSQMLYFMWYLLENYETNSLIRFLVDNTEIYFFPVVNPDGYVFNERSFKNGNGLGMHRKNMRRIQIPGGGVTFGVDLNRNYGFNFGLDNNGSSNDPQIETYRGPFAFSEPETKAVKWLCEQVPFEIALNHHSFGDALLIPFSDGVNTNPHYEAFFNMGKMLSECNDYIVGDSKTALGYFTNGNSDDWMYGDLSKPQIFAFTPEIGDENHGFWPQQTEILPLCRHSLTMNIHSVLAAHNYGRIKDMTPPVHSTLNTKVITLIEKLGLKAGSFSVVFEPLSDNIQSALMQTIVDVAPMQSKEVIFDIQLSPSQSGNFEENIVYALHLFNGHFTVSDTTYATFKGEETELFKETAIFMHNWRGSGNSRWGIDDSDYYSPFSCISDSPGVPYEAGQQNTILLRDPIFIPQNIENPYLTFRAKWSLDYMMDYVQLSVSRNGLTGWTPLCGSFTQSYTNINALQGDPVYTGFQNEWIKEYINLEEYRGSNIFLRWQLIADGANRNQYQGFFFDDLRIAGTSNTVSTTSIELPENINVYPNPTQGQITIEIPKSIQHPMGDIQITDQLGKILFTGKITSHSNVFNLSHLQPGFYLVHLNGPKLGTQVNKLIKH